MSMSESGTPFDLQESLRIGGRAAAINIMLKVLAGSDATRAILSAEKALARIGYQVSIEQVSPECPEAWLVGMHDIEQALREAIGLLGGRAPE